jgi:hypothetical protein
VVATILGSGFGLYGYLPALIEGCKQKIVLPLRYQKKLLDRPELASYFSKIDWVSDENLALQRADTVIIALRPADQFTWVTESLKQSNVKYLRLEKPLAESPNRARELFNNLLISKITFRIGYIFRHTAWARQFSSHLGQNLASGNVRIQWYFRAHHFRNNLDSWKRYTASGGGAIRFYGIHLLALLAEIGYRSVISSQVGGLPSLDQIERWKGVFTGDSLPICEVIVDSNSDKTFFLVEQNDPSERSLVFADLKDPFDISDEEKVSHLDQRVPLLADACRLILEDSTIQYKWYDAALDLWSAVEEKQIWDSRDFLN